MKTRNEIYQGKVPNCSGSLQLTIRCNMNRSYGSFPKTESIKSLITSLVKQKRIIYDKENGLLCDSQESANNPDYGMIASFWVLLDFKTAIMYHTDGEFPVKLNFFSKMSGMKSSMSPRNKNILSIMSWKARQKAMLNGW